MRMSVRLWPALLAALCLSLAAMAVQAEPSPVSVSPLLQQGKKSLFQRVVSHPGARLLAEPKADAKVLQEAVVPFTVLYVYARKDAWLQVGPSTTQPAGWLEAAKATDWNQSLTLLFTPRTGRDPVLFFKTEQDLNALCSAADMEKRLGTLLSAAAQAAKGERFPPTCPLWPASPREVRGPFRKSVFISCPFWPCRTPLTE